MGVLACDRRGCDSIMCDYYHHTHGYICSSCISELQEYLDQGNINIARFMNSWKHEKQCVDPLNAYDIFTRRE